MAILIPEFQRLLATLNNAKDLQQTNPALYQVIKSLIEQVKQFADSATIGITTTINTGSNLSDRTYLTVADETPYLPFSSRITAGNDVVFDSSVAHELKIVIDPFPEIFMTL